MPLRREVYRALPHSCLRPFKIHALEKIALATSGTFLRTPVKCEAV